jgi:hypothetical protein
MKEKRDYMKPAMQVVEVKQQSRLLAGSDRTSSAGVTNYTWQDVTEE